MGNVAFLGVEGAGKTVLTMALLRCFKAHEGEGWFLRPENNGAFRFLNQLPDELGAGNLPHQTVALRHLALNVLKEREPQRTFDILDYPGEVFRLAFLDAKDDPDPESFRERVEAHRDDIDALLGHLVDSDQVFVLFNLDDGRDLAANVRNSDAVWITNACLDYLHRLPNRPAVTLLLTQIDRYVDLATHDFNPGAYVAHHLPLIAHNFPDLDILAVSALGPATATHGLDGILLRCLYDTPFVQRTLTALRSATATINQAFVDLPRRRDQALCDALIAAIDRYNAAYANLDTTWFIPHESLFSGGRLLSPEAVSDLVSLFPLLQEVAAANRIANKHKRRHTLRNLQDLLRKASLRSDHGNTWKQQAIEAIDDAIYAVLDEYDKARVWQIIIVLLSLGAIALVIALAIA